VLKVEGKNKSPENKTSFFWDEYKSKAVLNLAIPPMIDL
jgi:hypothetical protein